MGSRYYVDPEADAAEESQEEVDAFFASAESGFDNNTRVLQGRRRSESTEGGVDQNNW